MIARKAADGLTITDVNFSIRSKVALNWLGKLGYKFSAKQQVPSRAEKQFATTPKKAEEKPAQPTEKTPSAEVEPLKEKQVSEGWDKAEEKAKPKGPSGGEILTEKKPYNMDELVAAMQEMEDMMEEMRGKIKDFKGRRR
jgi:serine protease Do